MSRALELSVAPRTVPLDAELGLLTDAQSDIVNKAALGVVDELAHVYHAQHTLLTFEDLLGVLTLRRVVCDRDISWRKM